MHDYMVTMVYVLVDTPICNVSVENSVFIELVYMPYVLNTFALAESCSWNAMLLSLTSGYVL